jgi:hypothetical protein
MFNKGDVVNYVHPVEMGNDKYIITEIDTMASDYVKARRILDIESGKLDNEGYCNINALEIDKPLTRQLKIKKITSRILGNE